MTRPTRARRRHARRAMVLVTLLLGCALGTLLPAIGHADLDYSYIDSRRVKVVPPFEITKFLTLVTNTGTETTQYTCTAHRDIPLEWLSTICSEGTCALDSLDVLLQPAESETLYVDIFAFGIPGSGTIEVRVRETLNPASQASLVVAGISGVNQLVVDDDDGAAYETFATAAFSDGGITAGVWPYAIEPPLVNDLEAFSSVYWLTGDATSQTLTPGDQLLLGDFLEGGGRLMVSGQGLGAEIGGTSFYADRLGATYVQDDAGTTLVDGVAGDPIGDGLAFAISGGDGANNQTSPDAILPAGPTATGIFDYDNLLGAGVRVDGGGVFKSVYLPFGFEGIATGPDRAQVLERLRVWLEEPSSISIGDASVPAPPTARLLRAAPNPTGSTTTLRFMLPGTAAPTVRLFDVAGRLVARLDARRVADAFEADWDGTGLRGVRQPPGIYFVRVEAPGQSILVGKIALAR